MNKSATIEYQREHRKQFRTTPHKCDCGRMGAKWTPTGWSCQRCLDLNSMVEIYVHPRPKVEVEPADNQRGSTFFKAWFECRLPVGESLKHLDALMDRNAQLQAA